VEVVFGGSVRHFQQYFSYIVAVSLFLVDETGVPGRMEPSNHYSKYLFKRIKLTSTRGRRGRDRMVVGFTTTYAISAYNH
jgi:hypothetical protein